MDATEALKKLTEGNARFASGKSIHPAQDRARLAEIAKAQHPFAVVVSCSDSRVPPEILFDQGMGDLFVVRTAGEVVGEGGIAEGVLRAAEANLRDHVGARHSVDPLHRHAGDER